MDLNNLLIKNRCRHYYRKKDRIFNCPEVDLSNKFAGGGLITTAEDLLRFGNFLLYCYQNQDGPIKQDVL
jgi:serine beta-lactamase-like protein LACTB